MNYLLDTNIIVAYVRDTEVTRKLETSLNLLNGTHNLVVSVVSLGEIRAIAKRNKWGEKKIHALENLIDSFLIADINLENIIERYAELDVYSQGKLQGNPVEFSARNMGKNDLWIAATASVYDLELLTMDKDFIHLEGRYLSLRLIDLAEY